MVAKFTNAFSCVVIDFQKGSVNRVECVTCREAQFHETRRSIPVFMNGFLAFRNHLSQRHITKKIYLSRTNLPAHCAYIDRKQKTRIARTLSCLRLTNLKGVRFKKEMLDFKRQLITCPTAIRRARRMLNGSSVLLLATVVAFTSITALAQEFDTVYQRASDGSIRQNTCSGNSCGSSQLLQGSDSTVWSIASGGGALYLIHFGEEEVYQYPGTPCNPTCPVWTRLNLNPKVTSMVAGAGLGGAPYLFELTFDGQVLQYTGPPCPSPMLCNGWQFDANQVGILQIIAAGGTLPPFCFSTNCPPTPPIAPLVDLLPGEGKVSQYTQPGWRDLDEYNPSQKLVSQIFGFVNGSGGVGSIFELRKDLTIWKYIGPPCNNGACPGWQEIGAVSTFFSVVQILTAETSGRLFVLLNDGSIWELTGNGWTEPGLSDSTVTQIAGSNNGLFRLHNNGAIMYLGPNGWVPVNNPPAAQIVASSALVTQ